MIFVSLMRGMRKYVDDYVYDDGNAATTYDDHQHHGDEGEKIRKVKKTLVRLEWTAVYTWHNKGLLLYFLLL